MSSPTRAVSSPTKERVRVGLALSAICVVILPFLLLYPFGPDNNVHQAMALQVLRYGDLPFVNAWYHSLPGIIGIHVIAIVSFGQSMAGFRAFDILYQIATVLALYKLLRRWTSTSVALLACSFYALFLANGPTGNIGQPDCFVILPLLVAIGLALGNLIPNSRPGVRFFLSGAAYAVAVAIRPTYGLLVAALFVSLIPFWKRSSYPAVFWIVGGFFSVLLALSVPFLLTRGALHEAWLAIGRYNFEVYTPASRWEDQLGRRTLLLYSSIVLWFLVSRLGAGKLRISSDREIIDHERLFLYTTFAALLFGVVMMRRAPTYHYFPIYAFCIPVVAYYVYEFIGKLTRWRSATIGVLVLGLSIVALPWPAAMKALGSGLSSAYSYLDPDPNYGYEAQKRVARWINARADSREWVEAIGSGIRWQLNGRNATRFTTVEPLVVGYPWGQFTDFQRTWQSEYVEQLSAKWPKYILILNDYDPVHRTSLVDLMQVSIPGLQSLLNRKYKLDTVIGKTLIYGRV